MRAVFESGCSFPVAFPPPFPKGLEGQGGGYSGSNTPKVASKDIDAIVTRLPVPDLRSLDKSRRSFEPEIPLPVPPPFSEKGGGDALGKPLPDSKSVLWRKTVWHYDFQGTRDNKSAFPRVVTNQTTPGDSL